jgi:hypothetical protein
LKDKAVHDYLEDTMHNHNYELYWQIARDRQAELARELEKEVLLRDPNRVTGSRRRALLSLAATAVLVVVIVVASLHVLA